MSSVNSFQRHIRLSVWTTNSAFTVTLLFYIHPQYTYQPPEMNVSILSVYYGVHPVVLSMNYISIIATSSSHIRGYSILLVEIRMSTRWSTECIVDGLVQNPSCPSFFDHPKTLNSLEFSQNNKYRVLLCMETLVKARKRVVDASNGVVKANKSLINLVHIGPYPGMRATWVRS